MSSPRCCWGVPTQYRGGGCGDGFVEGPPHPPTMGGAGLSRVSYMMARRPPRKRIKTVGGDAVDLQALDARRDIFGGDVVRLGRLGGVVVEDVLGQASR